MQPEDIDQLFRERLAGHAPTPPAFVWAEIEAEIQPAQKRRPVMWLAAAAVALLTLLGGAWWVLTGSGLNSAGRAELAATAPARGAAPASAAEPEAAATAATESTNPTPSEKKMLAQATPASAPSSSPSEAIEAASAQQPAPVVATTTPASAARSAGVQPDPAAERRPSAPAAPVASVASANVPASVSSLTSTATSLPTTSTPAALSRPASLPTPAVALTGPIEVEVRPATEAPAPVTADRRPGLVSLLRQAGKVVKGERVSLTEAGLPESVTVQARLAGHTLTKVIQL
ncbi:hypothetical protein KLP40_13455 [Hymenobacter sp. NST-14]|uniref:hypothetical protein n=1 Tax=Hymenobacter piscis TaxID=2839984 RepID=UPI001C00AAAA|nr:hypothetical protein [Hymenobacter piscis]MBT9394174.1 hypothetical protein [Hymenobacter piscis]